MKATESAGDFLERNGKRYSEAGQFNVYKVDEFTEYISLPPCRRDFYKICLIIRTNGVLTYADRIIPIKENAITFGNPMIPYTWERQSEREEGYFCLFTEDFVNSQLKSETLSDSPLFRTNGHPVLYPDPATMTFLVSIFEKMLLEMQSSYKNKYELLRSYVQIIIHESLKIQPPEHHYLAANSASRISDLFLELLERQFPIASPQHTIRFRNASEFANQLSIHTNHLNRSLKETTGKTTSEHIAEKLIQEAKALLQHSNWDVANIGYCLGFEHPSNFNIFFKKQTGQTPNHFRRQVVSGS